MKRRNFIKKSTLTSAGTLLIPGFLKAWENVPFATQNNGKTLVIVQWSGGNDGLNTVVPYRNDLYYQNRPRLAIQPNEVLKLNDDLGLNPVMKGLKSLYDEGYLSVINNVGYPNPNRSHFRSMDIWQTASDSDEYLSSGWLGRYLDSTCEGSCETAHTVIEVDDTLSLAMKGKLVKGLALKNAQKLYEAVQSKEIRHLAGHAKQSHANENTHYLYKTLAETVSSAEYIYNKSQVYKSKLTYPNNSFAQQLKTVAEFINSGLDTRVYYTSLSGFDTHVNQKPKQERLLKNYAEAIQLFVKDLRQSGRLKDTVIMTFSEFGRRVAQNASNGTDHGTANNLFIINGDLKKPGIFNELPDLSELDHGDLKYSIDFRRVYASLLQKHLEVDDQKILGRKFEALNVI